MTIAKLYPIRVKAGATFIFDHSSVDGVETNYNKFDGYLEYWNPETGGIEQLHFNAKIPDPETYNRLYMGRHHPHTGERLLSSKVGAELYQVALDLRKALTEWQTGAHLVGLVFFHRPALGFYASRLNLYKAGALTERWRYTLERTVYVHRAVAA